MTRPDHCLWVCWRTPAVLPPDETPILAFLPAREQVALHGARHAGVIDGRTLDAGVRRETRDLYIRLVADIGIATLADGRTLRQALAGAGRSSSWWYHPVAIRDTEDDPTFLHLLQLRAIAATARQHGIGRLVLVGAPRSIAAALRSAFEVDERMRVADDRWRRRLRALGSRGKIALRTALQARAAGRAAAAAKPSDVAFVGYWPWSVNTGADGQIVDRYFARVPSELESRGVSSLCWLAWLDGLGKVAMPWRALARAAAHTGRVVVLQSFLTTRDIAGAVLDARPLLALARIARRVSFRRLFVRDGIDLYPLFRERLLLGLLGGSLPLHELVAVATERASRRVQPKFVFEFQDHFPAARARYEGLRRGAPQAVRCALQHASYGHETTILALDAEREYLGQPDGSASPHADCACAMGQLGRALFVEYGYPPEQVRVTGSPRHEQAGLRIAPRTRDSGPVRVLVVATLTLEIDIEMLEAAYLASEGLPGLRLAVRNHPLRAVTGHRRFGPIAHRFDVTHATLDDDLASADVVLFSYSTVGEEAFLAGRPVVQWLPLAFHGSALAEVAPIPRCGTVDALRRIFEEYAVGGAPLTSAPGDVLADVHRQLFGPPDGSPAGRLADLAATVVHARSGFAAVSSMPSRMARAVGHPA